MYAASLMAFSLLSVLLLYAMLRTQSILPFNPTDREALDPTGAFNTAISFVTNTNWQWYSGEVSISHLTQMLGFAVHNFTSAAVGLAIVIALIRGITLNLCHLALHFGAVNCGGGFGFSWFGWRGDFKWLDNRRATLPPCLGKL